MVDLDTLIELPFHVVRMGQPFFIITATLRLTAGVDFWGGFLYGPIFDFFLLAPRFLHIECFTRWVVDIEISCS